jgi:hypothetical protein
MGISEALALETRHFINDGHTIKVEQQVEKDAPLVAKYLKSDATYREIDLHSAIAEFLRQYATGRSGLLFRTRRNTPHLYANLEDRWLTPRQDETRRRGNGLALVQAIPQDVVAWSLLLGGHQQFLDGPQARNASSRGTQIASRRGRASGVRLRPSKGRCCSKCSKKMRSQITV